MYCLQENKSASYLYRTFKRREETGSKGHRYRCNAVVDWSIAGGEYESLVHS